MICIFSICICCVSFWRLWMSLSSCLVQNSALGIRVKWLVMVRAAACCSFRFSSSVYTVVLGRHTWRKNRIGMPWLSHATASLRCGKWRLAIAVGWTCSFSAFCWQKSSSDSIGVTVVGSSICWISIISISNCAGHDWILFIGHGLLLIFRCIFCCLIQWIFVAMVFGWQLSIDLGCFTRNLRWLNLLFEAYTIRICIFASH